MLRWLFDVHSFFTRTHCGIGWTPTLILNSRMANFFIFLAYFSIPLSLFIIWRDLRLLARRGDIFDRLADAIEQNRHILLMFCTFILACGLTHLNDFMVFEWAPYRFYTLVDDITAVLSIMTAIMLPVVSKRIVRVLTDRRSGE